MSENKWIIHEKEKKKFVKKNFVEKNLSTKEYEQALRELVKKLGI